MKIISPSRFYGHTNESLWSATRGLKLNCNDRVLSICGSGDHPFAFCEITNQVVAVDINHSQIEYSKRRAAALSANNVKDFFPLLPDHDAAISMPNHPFQHASIEMQLISLHAVCNTLGNDPKIATWLGSIKYFLGEVHPFSTPPYHSFPDHEKIGRIQSNISHISYKTSDLLGLLKEDSDFSKVFLSNSFLSWLYHAHNQNRNHELIERISALPRGCLIYSTECRGDDNNTLGGTCKFRSDLSEIARKNELPGSWSPSIYERI